MTNLSEMIDLAGMPAEIFGMPARMGKSFATWTLDADGRERSRVDLAAVTLDEAVKLATPPMMLAKYVKGGLPSFVILETDDTAREGKARHMLHFYNVKSRRDWRATGPCGLAQLNVIPRAIHAGSLPMNAFEPRRPFDARLDHPGNGRQPGEPRLIEAGARR